MDGGADKAQLGSGPMPAAGWAVGVGLTWPGPDLDSTQLDLNCRKAAGWE